MAIEFKCPFCTAMIRVPDNAGGGKGRCPKCAMRISVPKKSAAKPVAKATVDEEPFALPVADSPAKEEQPPRVHVSEFSSVPVPSAPADAGVFDPDQLTKPRIGEIPVDRTAVATSVAKRFQKKKKNGASRGIIAALVAVGLIAGAGFFALPYLLTERLSGELIAGKATTLELPSSLIEKSRLRLAVNDMETLLKKLEQNPVPLNSNSMQIQVSGTEHGLTVSLAAGPQAHFYRVNLKGNVAIEKYLSRHLSQLEETRLRDVDQAATDFLITYEKVLAKLSPSDSITRFRDSLALTSLVGGFGHELVAEYGRGLYRCAYEDRDGGLYFLLPDGVKEFHVLGFKHPDGTVVIPADFHVKVEGEIAPPKKSKTKLPAKPEKKEESKSEDRGKMQDDEKGDNK